MATWQTNAKYLSIAGIDVSNYIISAKLEAKYDKKPDTYGDVEDTSHYLGLRTVSLSGALRWDDTFMPTLLAAIGNRQSVEVVYGPNDNVAGQPKHQQNFKFDTFGIEQNAEKDRIEFPLSAESTGAPTKNMWNGVDVF